MIEHVKLVVMLRMAVYSEYGHEGHHDDKPVTPTQTVLAMGEVLLPNR